MLWSPTEVKTVTKAAGSLQTIEVKKEFPYSSGVEAEVAAFAKALENGQLDALQTPAEALKDLEILQRLLELGEGGAAVKVIES